MKQILTGLLVASIVLAPGAYAQQEIPEQNQQPPAATTDDGLTFSWWWLLPLLAIPLLLLLRDGGQSDSTNDRYAGSKGGQTVEDAEDN